MGARPGLARKTEDKAVEPRVTKFSIRSLAVCALLCAPLQAQASEGHGLTELATGFSHDVISFLGFGGKAPADTAQPVFQKPALQARAIEPAAPPAQAEAPHIPAAKAAAPSVEMPIRRLFCVEYARMRSGLAVFGDAKHWWERARNLYARLSHPVEEAVMVFSGSKRLKRGHVAVVTDIVGPREIIVDQANWQNRGEIDHATPVLDVSENNDWSQVRVWDIRSGTFGAHVYAISGFIAKDLVRQASRD